MKKILCIVQLPPPIHGASLMNSYLIKSDLINNNFNVQSVNLQFASSSKDLEKFSLQKIFKAFHYAVAIFKKCTTFKPDLVYFTLSPSGFAFYRDVIYVLILKICNCNILYHLHGKGIKKAAENNFLKKKLYKFVFRNTNVICLAHNLTDDIQSVCSSIPFIVPCGIPVHLKSNETIYKTNDVVQILYLSNYMENKGILKLIDALKIVKQQGFNFNARLVGAPTDLSIEAVQNYIKKKELEKYVFAIGPRYGEEKYDEFLLSDIFAFPTFYPKEAFPLVNLEAMQFSLPVISSNEGGISEALINNETGFLIDTKNVNQLAEKLKDLIQNKDLREEMGRRGKNRFCNHYTLKHFEQNLKMVFDNILNRDSKNCNCE
ncbi:glycosyltransferase [Hanamia caeni]|nr:glycosyltransferase [Hanamia caeni]